MPLEADIFRDGRIYKEAYSLKKNGADVKIVGFRSELFNRVDFPFSTISLPVVSRKRRQLRNISIIFNIILLNIRIMFERADVYHVHNTMFLPGSFMASRFYRGKMVYDCREVMFEASRIMAWLEKKFIFKADLIINVSEGRADYQAAQYEIPREKILVIHNYTLLPDQIVKEKVYSATTRMIFCGGYHLKDNRVDDFIEIIQGIPDIELDLIAFEYGHSGGRVQKLIKNLGLDGRVRFLPPVPFEQVMTAISEYDLAVDMLTNPENSLSKRYPAICKTSTYLAAGLPVVCSNMKAFEEEIEEQGLGISIDPNDKPAAREKINRLLKNKDRIGIMREKALRVSREKLNWDVDAKFLWNAYQDLMKR
jgi:glycosyltransferase involved in cell wall biosynthesis